MNALIPINTKVRVNGGDDVVITASSIRVGSSGGWFHPIGADGTIDRHSFHIGADALATVDVVAEAEGTPPTEERPTTRPSTTKSLSGNAYVPMRMQGEAGRPVPIRIFNARNCEHKETVCTSCAEAWSWDWDIFFDRTGGGRGLKAELDARLVASVAPR